MWSDTEKVFGSRGIILRNPFEKVFLKLLPKLYLNRAWGGGRSITAAAAATMS
jgi:hypothetical protein